MTNARRQLFFILWSSFLLALYACDNKKKKSSASPSPSPSYPYGYGQQGATASQYLSITESTSGGTTLYANVNQQYNWTFQVNNGQGRVSSVTSDNPRVQVNGTSVSFRPTTNQEITGTVTVSAVLGTQTGQETFYIVNQDPNASSGFGGILGSILGNTPLGQIFGSGSGGGGFGSIIQFILSLFNKGGNNSTGGLISGYPGLNPAYGQQSLQGGQINCYQYPTYPGCPETLNSIKGNGAQYPQNGSYQQGGQSCYSTPNGSGCTNQGQNYQ